MRQRTRNVRVSTLALLTLVGLTAVLHRPPRSVRAAADPRLTFEENRGQAETEHGFVSHGPRAFFGVAPTRATLAFDDSPAVQIALVGGRSDAPAVPLEPNRARSHYFRGPKPEGWLRDIPHYGRVRYTSVYPGVDVEYYLDAGTFEYDFVLEPGADASPVRIGVEGTRDVRLTPEGDAVFAIGDRELRQQRPHAFQETSTGRRDVEVRYVLRERDVLGLELGAYDRSRTLVIDPAIAYSTYLGFPSWDEGNDVAVDAEGNAYVAGLTTSANRDASIAKFDPSGALVYRTVLGGPNHDGATAVAVDGTGQVHVTGWTASWGFPVQNAIQSNFSDAYQDAFVTKLDANGQIVYSTYLGGNGEDMGTAIAIDGTGSAYVAGRTTSTNFPTAAAGQSAAGGDADAFIARLTPAGSALTFSTYLGGSGADAAQGIAIHNGTVYVGGRTASTNFPTRSPRQAAFGGGADDGFVAKLPATGGAFSYASYLGGADHESVQDVAVDSSGAMYVTGWRLRWPMALTAFTTRLDAGGAPTYSMEGRGGEGIAVNAAGEAYVTGIGPYFYSKLSTGGAVLADFAGFGGRAVAVSAAGDVIVTGTTDQTDLQTVNPYQATHADAGTTELSYGTLRRRTDAFVTRITDGPTPRPTIPSRTTPTPTPTSGTPPTATPTPTAGPTPTPTPTAGPTSVPPTRFEQDYASVTYAGSWFLNAAAVHSGGNARGSVDPGDRVTFGFTGSAVTIIGYQDEWGGRGRVLLDGVDAGTADFYRAPSRAQAAIFAASGLSAGTHTLVVEVTGTHSPGSGGNWLWIDAFDVIAGGGAPTPTPTPTARPTGAVTPTPTSTAPPTPTATPSPTASPSATPTPTPRPRGTPPSTTRYEDTHASVTYVTGDGAWFTNAASVHSGGTAHGAVDRANRVTFTFTGTAVTVIGYQDEWSGFGNVVVDGTPRGTADFYHTPGRPQWPVFTVSGLPPGSHTLSIEVASARNPASQSNWIWIDAFDVAP